MVRSKVKGQELERGKDQPWSRSKVGARSEEQLRSGTGIRNRVGEALQEAGKSRVQWGSSRKSAQLLRWPTQLTFWLNMVGVSQSGGHRPWML